MGASVIGSVRSGSGMRFEVKWDGSGKEMYVSCAGWTRIGKGNSAGDAMRMAEAWLYDKLIVE